MFKTMYKTDRKNSNMEEFFGNCSEGTGVKFPVFFRSVGVFQKVEDRILGPLDVVVTGL